MILEHEGTYVDAHGTTWEPWTDGHAVGFKVTTPDGHGQYVYLNPSSESDDGKPNVFLYHGPTGKPDLDGPVTYVDIVTL